LFNVNLGHGEIGGYVSNYYSDARIVNAIALRILKGEKPQNIPRVGASSYVFDWEALHKWKLDPARLPEGSVFVNKPPTFWESYRQYILAGFALLLLQTSLVLGLLVHRWRRKQSEKSLLWHLSFEKLLSDLSTMFISLSERDVDANIETGLSRVGTFLNLSRITIFEATDDRAGLHPSYAWNAPGVRNALRVNLPWWDGQILRGKTCLMSRIEDLPPEASAEKAYFCDRGIVSAASIPIRMSGEIYGAIVFVSVMDHVSWTDDLVGQLRVTGEIFCNAIKRKRAGEVFSTLSRRLIEAQEEERARIARELHDDANQRIAIAVVSLDTLKQDSSLSAKEMLNEVEDVKNQLIRLGDDIQTLSHELHSAKLEQLGFSAAAESFCKEHSEKHKTEIVFQHENVPEKLPAEIGHCLFRVLQEALNNALKHSDAKRIQVSLSGESDVVQLTVRDFGKGFDAREAMNTKGIGLASMAERLKLIHGELSIQSEHNRGTTIAARVPLILRTKSAGAGTSST
jgi:signal transduction histidine kinase